MAEEDARFAASKSLAVHLVLTSANAPGNVQDVDPLKPVTRHAATRASPSTASPSTSRDNGWPDPSFDWAPADLL